MLNLPDRVIASATFILVALLCVFMYWAGYTRASAKAQIAAAESMQEAALNAAATESVYRQRERELLSRMDAIATNAQKEISDVQKDRDRTAAALAAGKLRYTIPVTAPTVPATCTNPVDTPAESRAELSIAAAQFLDRLAADADEVTLERNMCVAILKSEREK